MPPKRVDQEPNDPPPELVKLLDMRDLADYLGVGRDKIFYLMKHEGLPYIKWGSRTIKFHPADVARWLASQSESM
jgi:excisionase family DNA binding protein